MGNHHHYDHLPRKHHRFWLIGLLAFMWIIVRSGLNPKRLSYPCQQAAMPLAAGWLISLGAFLGGGFALRRWTKVSGIVLMYGGILWFLATIPQISGAGVQGSLALPYWEVANPVSRVFVLDSIPPTSGSLAAGNASVPDAYLSDPAIDSLFLVSASQGVRIHKTSVHPDGIVGANNVVVIKGNFQWEGRVTTSTDRIKGLIWQILSHPDGFTGEIIVCDNTQGRSIDANDNNSEDRLQSILSVVSTFRAKGYPVYLRDWSYIYSTLGSEYSRGDYHDAFMYDSLTKVSYPKFRSPSGKYLISLRYGIWDSLATRYDSSRLCLIDFAVLKRHGMAGATIAVKNWIGVMTTAYWDQRYGGYNPMHYTYLFSPYALVARIMNVTYPRLSMVDAAWTAPLGNTTESGIVNTKVLFASTDPVAVSWYAAKYVLTPVSDPNATDPDLAGSTYHGCLTNWWRFLRDSAGRACSMNASEISVYGRKSLVVSSPPPIPLLKTPDQGAINQPVNPLLEWNASIGAVSYHVQLSSDSNFTTLFFDEDNHPGTSVTVSGLAYASRAYWRVRGRNAFGESAWSEVRGFMTVYPLNVCLVKDWNIVSLPAILANQQTSAIFPGAVSSAFSYLEGVGYRKADTIRHGNGYWIKYGESKTLSFDGISIGQETLNVKNGWNLIGSIATAFDVRSIEYLPPTMTHSKFFGYNGSYAVADSLEPCRGYWVKVNMDGTLILSAPGPAVVPRALRSGNEEPWGKLTFESYTGKVATLYLDQGEPKNLTEYEMPPIPPEDIFDVRFASGQNTEFVNDGRGEKLSIRIQSADYPMTISWKMRGEGTILAIENGGTHASVNGSGSIVIRDAELQGNEGVRHLSVTVSPGNAIPEKFRLEQNYPNPFNPSTLIHYDLPYAARVRLQVYDVLGRCITTILDDVVDAGYREARWDGRNDNHENVAAGLYVYRIEAKGVGRADAPYVAVKKMLLVK